MHANPSPGLASTDPSSYQAIVGQLDNSSQTLLNELPTMAEKRRLEIEEEKKKEKEK
jgi:hypothetical protein